MGGTVASGAAILRPDSKTVAPGVPPTSLSAPAVAPPRDTAQQMASSSRPEQVEPAPSASAPPPMQPPSLPQRAPPPPRVAIAPTLPNDAVVEEASLLRAARAALAQGDGALAMTHLDEHAARFPDGALSEERQAARVFALCSSGRVAEARAMASAFIASSPRSPLAAQVRLSCAGYAE